MTHIYDLIKLEVLAVVIVVAVVVDVVVLVVERRGE